jgi:hypothetical protein
MPQQEKKNSADAVTKKAGFVGFLRPRLLVLLVLISHKSAQVRAKDEKRFLPRSREPSAKNNLSAA